MIAYEIFSLGHLTLAWWAALSWPQYTMGTLKGALSHRATGDESLHTRAALARITRRKPVCSILILHTILYALWNTRKMS